MAGRCEDWENDRIAELPAFESLYFGGSGSVSASLPSDVRFLSVCVCVPSETSQFHQNDAFLFEHKQK